MGLQVPPAQDSQGPPSQGPSQHVPSTQYPELQAADSGHGAPLARLTSQASLKQ